jgi:hypothetical protein
MGTFIRGSGDLRLGVRPAGARSSLLTGLVSYWKLDETSGTRTDSAGGGNDLTDNNTVAGSAGKIGNAADFIAANTEFLSRPGASSVNLDGGASDYTYSAWIKTTTVATQYIFGKSAPADHAFYINSPGILRFEIASFYKEAIAAAAVNDGNWHHVVCWNDVTTNICHLAVDNGTVQNSAALAGYVTAVSPFTVGSNNAGTANFDGSVDELGRWSRLLTATERTSLYNGGTGITYPFVGT